MPKLLLHLEAERSRTLEVQSLQTGNTMLAISTPQTEVLITLTPEQIDKMQNCLQNRGSKRQNS